MHVDSLKHPLSGRAFIFPDRTLPDIRWIAGGSCGGKTVSSRHISKASGIPLYDCDENRQRHYERADPGFHPALSRKIVWSDFFASPEEEIFIFWEALCFERMEMIFEDLSLLTLKGPVIVEGVYAVPEMIRTVTPDAPALFLFADEEFLRSCYYGRESTLWMEDAFAVCENPEKTRGEWMRKWLPIDIDRRKRALACGYPCLEADCTTDWKSYEILIQKILFLQLNITKL